MQVGGEMEVERRKHARKKAEQLIYVELGPDNGGMMLDLSDGGVGFCAVSPVRKGEHVKFALVFDDSERFEGEGQVVWTDEEAKFGQVVRLQFIYASEELREQVRKYLKEEPVLVSRENKLAAVESVVSVPQPIHEEIQKEPQQALPEEAASEVPAPEVKPMTVYELAASAIPAENARFLPGDARTREIHSRVSQELREPIEEELVGRKWRERVTVPQVIGVMFVLALLTAVFVSHRAVGHSLIWLGGKIAGSENTMGPATIEGSARQQIPVREDRRPLAAEPAISPSPLALPPAPGPPASGVPGGSPQANLNQEAGQSQFLEAMKIVNGKNKTGELPAAALLLWSAVEKGHSGAEVALADLYRRGEGVVKSCVQARVLLTAATRKGNAEAKKRLEQLENVGCE
jgi:hypothetical protein